MKWIACAIAFVLLASATPAIGSFHTSLQSNIPDRVFILAMSGTSFNGLHAPQTPLLEAYVGERVRFMVPATERHTFHLHGHPWLLEDGTIVDVFLVDIDRPHVFDVRAGGLDGNAGDWLYHCHINEHISAGMWGVFRVYPFKAEILPDLIPGISVQLTRLGEPLDDASLAVSVDGIEIPAHVEPLGNGRYQIHAAFPASGALVITATHAEHGMSLVRHALGGGETPMPSVAIGGAENLHGHAADKP